MSLEREALQYLREHGDDLASLEAFCRSKGLVVAQPGDPRDLCGSGSEGRVYRVGDQAWKIWDRFRGLVKLDGTPIQWLERMILANEYLGADCSFIGCTNDGLPATVRKYHTGMLPKYETIRAWMEDRGFRERGMGTFEGASVLVVDCFSRNATIGEDGQLHVLDFACFHRPTEPDSPDAPQARQRALISRGQRDSRGRSNQPNF